MSANRGHLSFSRPRMTYSIRTCESSQRTSSVRRRQRSQRNACSRPGGQGPLFYSWFWENVSPRWILPSRRGPAVSPWPHLPRCGRWLGRPLPAPWLKVLVTYSTVAQLGYASCSRLLLHWQQGRTIDPRSGFVRGPPTGARAWPSQMSSRREYAGHAFVQAKARSAASQRREPTMPAGNRFAFAVRRRQP